MNSSASILRHVGNDAHPQGRILRAVDFRRFSSKVRYSLESSFDGRTGDDVPAHPRRDETGQVANRVSIRLGRIPKTVDVRLRRRKTKVFLKYYHPEQLDKLMDRYRQAALLIQRREFDGEERACFMSKKICRISRLCGQEALQADKINVQRLPGRSKHFLQNNRRSQPSIWTSTR